MVQQIIINCFLFIELLQVIRMKLKNIGKALKLDLLPQEAIHAKKMLC
jgi:hypothetical protein